jgi:large subunit ribosomal protein L16
MLQPKRVVYRNIHRGRRKGVSSSGNSVDFGDFGLKATTSAWLSARQIEAARRVMTRYARSGGKMWIRVFPDKSVTARAAETRMGKGKGAVEYWVAVVKPGRVIFEVAGLPVEIAKEALTLASAKLPLRTKIVHRQEISS